MYKSNVEHPAGSLLWPPLVQGTLIKRYKRFLADVRLEDGSVVTAHCPNSGSMTTCSTKGRPVYLSRSANPDRKLAYTWELIDMGPSLVGVNTNVPNRLVKAACMAQVIPELAGYEEVRSEVKINPRSRLDLLLSDPLKGRCYVEIKNCTLVADGQAKFPDAVTSRGLKHLGELRKLLRDANRCVMFYLIQRMDAETFSPADHIDSAYGKELRQAVDDGVEIIVYDVNITLLSIGIGKKVACQL